MNPLETWKGGTAEAIGSSLDFTKGVNHPTAGRWRGVTTEVFSLCVPEGRSRLRPDIPFLPALSEQGRPHDRPDGAGRPLRKTEKRFAARPQRV